MRVARVTAPVLWSAALVAAGVLQLHAVAPQRTSFHPATPAPYAPAHEDDRALAALAAPRALPVTQEPSLSSRPSPRTAADSGSLTDVPGVLVGHAEMDGRPTGCTVILFPPDGAIAGVDVRGAAPGTRETDLLDPLNSVQQVHAITLAGGSAFGLDAATGVMRYLDERRVGFRVGRARVPIVPAAILFDLGVGDDQAIRPDADCGLRAARAASAAAVPQGSVGAGAGATVGKARGLARAMKGGIGSASIRLEDDTVVAALVAVNAWGDIVDPTTGRVVAGTRTDDGRGLADVRTLMRRGTLEAPFGANTTLAVVATTAPLTKTQATLVARMAHDGFARAIVPTHTPYDGDTVFVVSTAAQADAASGAQASARTNLAQIGGLAAEAVSSAILSAIRHADSLPGLPSARELDTLTSGTPPAGTPHPPR